MNKKIILTGITVLCCFLILFISSSFKTSFIVEDGCSGPSCLRGWNPNTQDSTYYKTGMASNPVRYVCCKDEADKWTQGCQAGPPE